MKQTIALQFIPLLIFGACSSASKKTKAPDTIPPEILSEFEKNVKKAELLAEYDSFAWIASDSVRQFIQLLGPEKMQGYVIEKFPDSTVVSFGSENDSGYYMKYCQVVFDLAGDHPMLFENGLKSSKNEDLMFSALTKSRRELSNEEYEQGKHNFYILMNNDSIEAYHIPGYLPGKWIFGGSRYFQYAGGKLIRKRNFHLGYQYVREVDRRADVSIISDLNKVPNECDIMKYLAYKNFISRLKIRTSEFDFILKMNSENRLAWEINRL